VALDFDYRASGKRLKGMFKKLFLVFIIIALVGAGFFVYQTCVGTPIVRKIDKTIPSIEEAPFEVSTMTRIYYAEKAILNNDKTVTMYGWYERDGKKWVYREKTITLPAMMRPRIRKR